MAYRIWRGTGPVVFHPFVDFAALREPSIIDAF
jgi:hypothetical protein